MNIVLINQTDSTYSSSLKKYFADNAQKTIAAIGNPDILQNKTLAIFSSIESEYNKRLIELGAETI